MAPESLLGWESPEAQYQIHLIPTPNINNFRKKKKNHRYMITPKGQINPSSFSLWYSKYLQATFAKDHVVP